MVLLHGKAIRSACVFSLGTGRNMYREVFDKSGNGSIWSLVASLYSTGIEPCHSDS